MDLMPSAYALNLIEVARQQDIDLLEATGLTIAELEAEVYIPLSLHQRVVNSFNRLTSDPAWAFDFGQRLGINAHGALGLAAVSAPTVGAGMTSLCRYLRTRTCALDATTRVSGEDLVGEFIHTGDIRRQLPHACETVAMIIQNFLTATTGRVGLPLRWHFPYVNPAHGDRYTDFLWGKVEFEATSLRVVLPGSLTRLTSLLKDEALSASAERKCAELLQSLSTNPDVEAVRSLLGKAYVLRVRESRPVTRIPTAFEVASDLHISTRTLMRRLQEADTSLKDIKDQMVASHLREMLRHKKYSVSEIGQRLGYENPGNFTRACKRLLGKTPQALLRETKLKTQ